MLNTRNAKYYCYSLESKLNQNILWKSITLHNDSFSLVFLFNLFLIIGLISKILLGLILCLYVTCLSDLRQLLAVSSTSKFSLESKVNPPGLQWLGNLPEAWLSWCPCQSFQANVKKVSYNTNRWKGISLEVNSVLTDPSNR